VLLGVVGVAGPPAASAGEARRYDVRVAIGDQSQAMSGHRSMLE
jgi:hypothetical protein